MTPEPTVPVPPPGCPAHDSGLRVPLYTAEYAADPQAYYAHLRHYGPAAPVEIAPGVEATLVTDHATALQLLQDSSNFRKDARRWRDVAEGKIGPDSPVVPMLGYRPNAMFTDGAEHARLRQAITDTLARVDSRQLTEMAKRASEYLISQVAARGSIDLMNDYVKQLPLLVFNELFGCPADIGDRVVFGISGVFEGVNAEKANAVLGQAVFELVALKRAKPADDVTSWLMRHEARLTDEELVHQLILLLGAGAEPLRNLIGNTLHRLLTHDRYADGGLIDEAIDDTLWENPPMANYAPHYPASDMEFGGMKLRAGDLVMVSMTAANTDPALAAARKAGGRRAHLSWSAGPHACPSKDIARLVTMVAIESLLNRLHDIELAVPEDSLTWRPGPFHRALAGLPCRFTPQVVQRPNPPRATETSPRVEHAGAGRRQERGGVWSSFLTWLKG
ncbi:Cytochrome P450 [Streptomyces graminofaciens]|jgi:cytochrome P450|uniref:Cytochrome P450 n=1 Tax=Streptomyces graminofaciens TaxID=68212 RepID=A0ABM7FFL0_9ACTN|nr:cytochrome P450 [Streptomyces graminofaciens]BBC34965.1 Cytochrome P450 [Streptomyces graminofaciens]